MGLLKLLFEANDLDSSLSFVVSCRSRSLGACDTKPLLFIEVLDLTPSGILKVSLQEGPANVCDDIGSDLEVNPYSSVCKK